MDLETSFLKILHDKPRNLAERLFLNALKFFSFVYLFGWWARKITYRSGFFTRKRLACPVVSVGNLTTGGTGKTPVVIALAKHFCEEGKRVAILSRGYRRRKKRRPLIWVSDGQKLLASPEEGGDEPVLIAQSCPQAAVVVGADRYRAGLEVIRSFHPDLIILDDGFQRRFQLHRDLDILVIDGINPFSTGWILPAGLLREPMAALAEADVLVLNKVNQARSPEDIKTVLRHHNPRAYLVESRYHPVKLRNLETGKEVKPGSLDRLSVGAFSGVASPLSFIRTLAEFKVLVRHAYTLRDHYPYTREKLEEILEDARLRGLGSLVTTQKDAVKLPKNLKTDIPILALDIRWEVSGGKSQWDMVLKNISLACSPAPKARTESV
jgi:tetraacyldisaccharide 4'-kinase